MVAGVVSAAEKELNKMTAKESDAFIEKLAKKKVVYNEKLAKLGKRLARASHTERNFRYNFKVLESSKVNAVSLGNGSIYVNRGLLDHYKNNDQGLAFVIAHEIAHTMLRHYDSNRNLGKSGKELKKSVNGLKKEENRKKTKDKNKGLNITLKMLKKGFKRQQEYDADRWAMFYLTRIGYSAMVGVRALQKLKEAGNYTPDREVFSNHPTNSNRITHAFEVMVEISDAIANFEYGEIYLGRGEFESAADAFGSFLTIFSDSPEGYANLGFAYAGLASMNLDKSDYFLGPTIAKLDVDFILRGSGTLNEKYYQQAVEAFTQSLSLRPGFTNAISGLGIMDIRAKKYEKAAVRLKKVVSLDRNSAEYHNNLGVYFIKTNKAGDAISAFEKALGLDPKYAGAIYNLGLIHQKQNEHVMAVESFRNYYESTTDVSRKKYAKLFIEESLKHIRKRREEAISEGSEKIENSLLGVQLGMSFDDVKVVMGEPFSDTNKKRLSVWRYDFTEKINIYFEDGKVIAINVATPTRYENAKTCRNISFGDSMSKVKQAYGIPLVRKKQLLNYPVYGVKFVFESDRVVRMMIYGPRDG